MDTNELFWATGINNTGLQNDVELAVRVFESLSTRVNLQLDSIITKYEQVHQKANLKFDNPVDASMISSIKQQIGELGKIIDTETNKIATFASTYDKSISKIQGFASKMTVPGGSNSPLAPMVAGIQSDVAKSSEQLSFMERRFKYAFGSMLAYGSMRILKTVSSDIIEVKTQFEFLQTAINSFAGSAEKGAKIMHELTQFAVNSPLQVNDITEAAKQLMAFGVEADNVVGQIKMLSDVAAGAGKPIKDIAYIYGKSLTEGKVYTRTLMQFGNLGIPIYKALADVMDTTPSKIKKMTQMGAVGFDDIKRAIESLTSAGGQYYGFSDKMMSTTAGLLSNLKDKWILAMKDMGESSDGFINMSVRLVDFGIAHWQALGDAIVVVATAVGSYQVAKTLVSMGNTFNATTANLAEVASLETLVSAETQAAIAKTGFVVGSEAYGKAIRKEVAALLASAEAEEIAAAAKMKSATAKAVSAEKTLLSASAEGVDTAEQNFNTASAERNVAATELKNATKKKEIIINEIDSASEMGQLAATNLVAAAKARLIAITATLNRTITNNPYIAVGVAIVTLVAIMWALYDSTTAAERAQKNLKVALDEIQAQQDRLNKKFSDNLDIIKNPVYKNTPEQQKAFQILHDQFGAIIGDMKIKDLMEANSTVLQNKTAQAVSYTVGVQERQNKLTKEGNELNAARALVKALPTEIYDPTTGGNMPNLGYIQAQKDFEDKRLLYIASLAEQKEYLKNYNAANAAANAPIPESDKKESFWTLQKKDAAQAIKDIDSYSKARLDAANKIKPLKVDSVVPKVDPIDVKGYVENNAKIKEADEQLLVYQDAKNAKANTRASDLRNREAADAAKRLEAIRANNTELANLKSKAETDATQATIDAMDAGYAKEKAQQENNFEKKLTSLNSEKATILKKEQENIDAIFRNMNPNKSKTSTPAPTVTSVGEGEGGTTAAYNSLLSQATAGGMTNTATLIKESLEIAKSAEASYNSQLDSLRKDEDAKLGVLLEKQLLEYGDYTAKKTKIEKDYSLTLAALEKDRAAAVAKNDTALVARIDTAKIQAQTNQAKDQMALAFDQLKSTPEFAMAFEDLGNVSTETLEKLIGEMEKLKTANSGALSLADYKVYAKELGKMTDGFIERNPFKALKKSAEELKVAQDELNQATAYQGLVKSGFKIGDNGMIAPVSGVEQTNELAAANANVAKKTDDVTRKQNDGIKAVKEITDAYGKLSKEMSSLGSSIGGIAGTIISSIGDIGSFVTTSITAWKAASVAGAEAIGAVEKASIILGAISLVISIATAVINAITDAEKAQKEAAQAAIDNINAVKKAYLDAYAEMTDKKFSNIFGDDVFGKATAQAELMVDAAKNYNDNRNALIETQSKLQATVDRYKKLTADGDKNVYLPGLLKGAEKDLDTFNSKWGNIVSTTIDGFDIVAAKAELAGMKVDSAEYKLLKSSIDSWESYQTYLDSVTSYLSSIFGQLGSSMMDALVNDADNMTAWADDVTGYISDSFTKMVKDIIYNMDFASLLTDEQAKIKDILATTTTTDAQKEQAMQDELTAFRTQLITAGNQAAQDWNSFNAAWIASGGTDLAGNSTNPNDLTSAIKSMDQPTADILTAQFSAVRIHTANMDLNLSKIGNNVSDLLLSLQGQTSILQIAFNDVSEIARNTRDLAGIKSILSDIKTYGVKVL